MTSLSLPSLLPEQLAANQGPGIVVGNIIVAVAAVLAVGLRIWARKIQGLSPGLDDWLIFAALVFAIDFTVRTLHH